MKADVYTSLRYMIIAFSIFLYASFEAKASGTGGGASSAPSNPAPLGESGSAGGADGNGQSPSQRLGVENHGEIKPKLDGVAQNQPPKPFNAENGAAENPRPESELDPDQEFGDDGGSSLSLIHI